jgi:hypothetical protein
MIFFSWGKWIISHLLLLNILLFCSGTASEIEYNCCWKTWETSPHDQKPRNPVFARQLSKSRLVIVVVQWFKKWLHSVLSIVDRRKIQFGHILLRYNAILLKRYSHYLTTPCTYNCYLTTLISWRSHVYFICFFLFVHCCVSLLLKKFK